MAIPPSSPTRHPLRYSAAGLPAGTIDKHSGLVSGTPTQAGSERATVRARAGNTVTATTFNWTVEPNLVGDHTLQTPGGHALQDPDGTSTPGVQLTVGTGAGPAQNLDVPTPKRRLLPAGQQGERTVHGRQRWLHNARHDGDPMGLLWRTNQRWRLVPSGNDAYTVINVLTSLLLTASSDDDGAGVTQERNTGSPLQQWHLQ